MNNIVGAMLKKYSCHSMRDYENAMKEIVQELALLGLWRAKFFEHAAFYGGTSLRILYGLDRFSEDLDFSLLAPKHDFSMKPYLKTIAEEITGAGLHAYVTEKEKTKESAIQSAFIKGGTLSNLIAIETPKELISRMHDNQLIKIKIEVDTNPPLNFNTEAKHLLQPIPFSVLSYQLPDLFAGKAHALLCREWQTRVKGRDWYDFVWFIANDIPIHTAHLKTRLVQSNAWEPDEPFTEQDVRRLLSQKINQIDFEQAKCDVLPFLRRQEAVQLWAPDFFLGLLGKMRCV
ncbi:MAG: nucleotidyl transferase AbiEii/AbiGii toxin family protein [Gammaproteobacteria bacterium]